MNEEMKLIKDGLQEDIQDIKTSLTRLEGNTNRSLAELGEATNASIRATNEAIEKLANVVQEFQLMVAREYIERQELNNTKSEINKNINTISNKLDEHIKEEKNTRLQICGIAIAGSSFILGLFKWGLSLFN